MRATGQRLGVSRATSESLRLSRPGSTSSKSSFSGYPTRRQESTTESIARDLRSGFGAAKRS